MQVAKCPAELCIEHSRLSLFALWPFSLAITSNGLVVLWFCVFYVQEHRKAQPAAVLVFKCLRRRDHGLRSHPTDWEKPGIELATPGLQDIGLSPAPRRLLRCLPIL